MKILLKRSKLVVLFLVSIHIFHYIHAQNCQPRKPNVIYILADDMGYGELGCYGQQKIKTRNIDNLARQGMRFIQHYAGTPVCAPSHCNLLTGQHSGHAYVRGNYGLPNYKENEIETGSFPIQENMPTLGNIFKKAGYATAAMGTWHGLPGNTMFIICFSTNLNKLILPICSCDFP